MKLNYLTIDQARHGLKNKDFSSVELVSACYDQIEAYGEKICAQVTVVDKEAALARAAWADGVLASDGVEAYKKYPLLGIPYSCKDIFNTIGIKTTASSNVLREYTAVYESTVTQRLKDAGAILIAKDNLDAFSHGSSTEESDIFITKNPWDLSRLPGGSSGGTAAAVAANMVIFGIGGDTGGSIRCPASWCGVTGLKPTYGRVSRYGAIAMASSTDCPGPITKSAYDSALVLAIIAGKDLYDATTSSEEVPQPLEETASASIAPPSTPLKIGIAQSFFQEGMEQYVIDSVKNAAQEFGKLGHTLVDVELLDPKYALSVYTIIQRSEVSSNLARYDGIRFGRSRDHFGHEAKKRMLLGAYVLSSGYYDAYYSKAQKVRTLMIQNFNDVFKHVDLIIAPTLPSTAPLLGASKTSSLWGELTDTLQIAASMAGLPSVAFPCGAHAGLPIGAQLIGPHFSESLILQTAHAFQQVTDYHKKFPEEALWES